MESKNHESGFLSNYSSDTTLDVSQNIVLKKILKDVEKIRGGKLIDKNSTLNQYTSSKITKRKSISASNTPVKPVRVLKELFSPNPRSGKKC